MILVLATPRKPSFSEPLEDVKAVVGQPLKLQARVMAFPAPEVKWFKDGTLHNDIPQKNHKPN